MSLSNLLLFLLLVGHVAAQADVPPASDIHQHYVQPGETLLSIAQAYGVAPEDLLYLNGLADPRRIYPGQKLSIIAVVDGLDVSSWTFRSLTDVGDLLTYAQRGRVAWQTVARANRVLNPVRLVPGQVLHFPPPLASSETEQTDDTPLVFALRRGVSPWPLRHLGPTYFYGQAAEGHSPLPYPVLDWVSTPQPIYQGETVILTMTTAVTATCDVVYLERVEPCFSADGVHLQALLGFSPLLSPGQYEVNARVHTLTETAVLSFPVLVSAGRFSFERIDLPPSRQGLSASELAQVERTKIAAARLVRTPERWWHLPFDFPLYAEVSSYFGSRRAYGGTVFNTYHAGLDLNASTGTPVLAPAAGVVLLAEPFAVRGTVVVLDHGWGVASGFWHLSRVAVEPGQRVERGQVVGYVGNTGSSTGPHLHWEMWVNGEAVNPLQWVQPDGGF